MTVKGRRLQLRKKITDIDRSEKISTDNRFPVISSDKSPSSPICDMRLPQRNTPTR